MSGMVTFTSGIATLTFDLYWERPFLRETQIEERHGKEDSLHRIRKLQEPLVLIRK